MSAAELYKSSFLTVATICCVLFAPARSNAQWWTTRAPADFEDCAERAEKLATKEATASALSDCNAKFAGRRKPGGGYAYFDFMQNRHFDIAGPNPTVAEQKYIDEQYTAYLDRQRRTIIAAAFSAKQQQLQQTTAQKEIRSVPAEAPNKPRPVVSAAPQRSKTAHCAQDAFSCNWPRLSEGIKDIKKLFGPSEKSKRNRQSAELATANR